ncbi:alpha beta-hydrolase [Hygrophoropsis aurantiaca]|uniref:Alpha beta-hydrolase n=1 Tax=Hygrophoropsis aurantiaca TaxID=72124 RepID=A0ACB8ADE6_9AGAM|nr:alpha beta-hydrolase [Hygrophoropsis aurantiaca]
MSESFGYGDLKFERPANQVKTNNVPAIPKRIHDGMKAYEDAARGFHLVSFERRVKDMSGQEVSGGIIVSHRPASAQVSQLYRMSFDTSKADLERITHFETGTGRIISDFVTIIGDDWRGLHRAGGAIMVMDLDGSEHFQLWRYWEDAISRQILPKIDGELSNLPGKGRIERLTHDDFRYQNLVISNSNKLMAFSSNKENNADTLIYLADFSASNANAKADSTPFTLPSKLVTPTTGQGTTHWTVHDFSIDDKYLVLTKDFGNAYKHLYSVLLSESSVPELIILPGLSENEENTVYEHLSFSRDPNQPHLLFIVTNGYGDFNSVVSYNLRTHDVVHITTFSPNLHARRPIPWDIEALKATSRSILFIANFEGWSNLFVMPLSGPFQDTVIEIKMDHEGGWMSCLPNELNGNPDEIVFNLTSYRSRGYLGKADISAAFTKVDRDDNGNAYISVSTDLYRQASAPSEPQPIAPKLIRYKSFDGLDVPAIYYHPSNGRSAVPAIIGIHGGPEWQATAEFRIPIHGYILNKLGCAIIYPNVRGSTGYGKRYMAADDVLKREDSVKDIGALLDHIANDMRNELDSARVAVIGNSYGGFMVFATLSHYSHKLACGNANFGITHWPTFLQNTAAVRRANRRREYGDETIPEIREFLEKISPINSVSKIAVPLLITHGETDTRVTIHEAINMYKVISKSVHSEFIVCEMEGHGYKQKSVIEYTNAAEILFLERYLLNNSDL